MIEIWKDVKNYEGRYQVSNLGNVKTLNSNGAKTFKKEAIMKPKITKNNRRKVGLFKDGKYKYFFVYRLVWEAFNGTIPNGLVVNHKDENSLNDCLDNIEICTQKYNANYGTCQKRKGEKKSISVAQCKNGIVIKVYKSITEAAKTVGVTHTAIRQCLNGRTKKSANYEWRYAYDC